MNFKELVFWSKNRLVRKQAHIAYLESLDKQAVSRGGVTQGVNLWNMLTNIAHSTRSIMTAWGFTLQC